MRRRRDQRYAWCCTSCFCNPWVNLSPWKMAAFTRFSTLCHFDLDFRCAVQICGCNTKTTGSDLFDGTVENRSITGFIFTAFTCIRFCMKRIHGDGHTFMGFFGNGAIAHRTCLESSDNGFNGFHFFDINRWIDGNKFKFIT